MVDTRPSSAAVLDLLSIMDDSTTSNADRKTALKELDSLGKFPCLKLFSKEIF